MSSQKPAQHSPPTTSAATSGGTTTTTAATGRSKTSVHVTALDSIVNVNSLFTLAVFIGLSFTTPTSNGAGNNLSCIASVDTVRQVIVYEVISFSCFLFSSLMAQSLKLAINLQGLASRRARPQPEPNVHTAEVDSFCLRYGLLGSAVGSVLGCTFLMLSIVDFIQVKLGVFKCGGKAVHAVVGMVVLVGSSLLVYILTALYLFCFM